MEQRISLITLGVADLERSRRFYVDGLGWRPVHDSDEIVFFQLNGVVFGLFPRAAYLADAQLNEEKAGVGAVALAHNVRTREAVDALLAEAAAAGATITNPARDAVWGGYTGHFTDPDGHLWEVAWNPGWQIDADGNVTVGKGGGPE